MAAGSMINLIASVNILAVEVQAETTGENSVAYIVTLSPADVNGRSYRTAAAVAADADLHATDKAALTAMIAAGGAGFGTVYVARYDTSTEDATDALAALTAAGYVPGWHFLHVVVAERVDAEIAFASDWVGALPAAYADLALVYGQLATSSIKSGTVPAGVVASDGATKTTICYDDRDSSYTVERFVGGIAGASKPISATDPTTTGRPSIAIRACPTSVGQMTADLTDPQLALVTGRGSGQASCVAHVKRTPTSAAATDRQWGLGYTVGGTLLDVEYTVARIKLDALARIASLVRVRSLPGNDPIRATAQDAKIVAGAVGERLNIFRDLRYLDRRPTADLTLGIPALPDAYTVVGSVSSSTGIAVAVALGIGADTRSFAISGIAYVG